MAEISKYEDYVIARIEEMEQDPADYNIEKIARIMMGGYCSIPPTEEEAEHVTELIERNMWWGIDDYRDFADDEIEARGMYGEVDSDGVAECLMEYLNGEDPNEMCMEDFDEIISDNKRL